MLDSDKASELSKAFESAYATWTAAQETGMDPLFVRMQLRKLVAISGQIESLQAEKSLPMFDRLWPKISEIKMAEEQLRSVQVATEGSRQIIECLSEIPELMLLEIDQLLGTKITPEMLSDFDLGQEE